MTTTHLFELQLAADPWLPEAEGLLVPLPPHTAHQVLESVQVPEGWNATRITSACGLQQALWVNKGSVLGGPLRMGLRTAQQAPVQAHFGAAVNRHTECTPDVQDIYQSLPLAGLPAEQRLLAVVEALSQRFNYDSSYEEDLEPAPLSCDMQTGNCLDINTAMMKLLGPAGVPSAYYIGYFFEAGRPLEVDDWHCWVSTLTAGVQQDWDIAHHMKRRLGPVKAGLNPIPGVRFAMSTGRGLRFTSPQGHEVEASHLGLPRWVLPNGRTRECLVQATLTETNTSARQAAEAVASLAH